MTRRVLVVLTDAGAFGLTQSGREAMGLGCNLAAALDSHVEVAVLASADSEAAKEAGESGAERILALDLGLPIDGDSLLTAVELAVREARAEVVVVNRGPNVLDLVPRLAARLRGGCVMGVTEVRVVGEDIEAVAAIFGGCARAVYRFSNNGPRVISGAPGVAAAPERKHGRTADVVVITSLPGSKQRVQVVESPRPAPEGRRLEDARVVVSGGRGLRDAENYVLIRGLAAALGGMPGASRAIVDDGWAPSAEQVGLTGRVVSPQVYLAFGISGASQHMAGCSNSKTIVAVNTDPNAPIFRYAHYGIADDCLAVLPELIRLIGDRAAPDGSE